MSHRNARLTVHGRRLLVDRVRSGRPVAHVAAEMGISATDGPQVGPPVARSRARQACPTAPAARTRRRIARPPAMEARVCRLRPGPQARPGPDRPDPGPARLDGAPDPDPPRPEPPGLAGPAHRQAHPPLRTRPARRTGARRRQEARPDPRRRRLAHPRPGRGSRPTQSRRTIGFDYIHSAVDDHSRLAYSEVHADEKAATCAGFLRRAAAFFADHRHRPHRAGADRQRLAYRKSSAWQQALADLGATGKRTRAYRPQTNGKVERFNRTLLDEWAYLRPYTSNERADRSPGKTSCTPTTTTAATPHSAASHRSAV